MVDLVLCTGNISCTLETQVLEKIDLQKDKSTMNFSIKLLNTIVESGNIPFDPQILPRMALLV